jgi:S1-C subfamily serine protease
MFPEQITQILSAGGGFGRGVPLSYGDALNWYKESADNGYGPARFQLAEFRAHNDAFGAGCAIGLKATSAPALSTPSVDDRAGKTASINLVLSNGKEVRPQEVFCPSFRRRLVVRRHDVVRSAVAISDRQLLTNCHVVGTSTAVELFHEGHRQLANVVSANPEADRCILAVSGTLRKWVRVRPYADVKVGDRVYTIGTPKGLELTLAEGVISSKRTADGTRLVQTNAAISQGSSGGGLFDSQGNLIGITTFMLKDSQNLNFAIAAEEYAK